MVHGGFLLMCAALAHADPSPTAPIEGIIRRVLGDGFVPAFALSIVPATDAPWCTADLQECAQVGPTTGHATAGRATVAVTATSANSLAYGLGMYLRTTCNTSITWAATVWSSVVNIYCSHSLS